MRRREFLGMAAAGAAALARPVSAAPPAGPTLIYVGALPHKMLVLDEGEEKVVDRIELKTGVGRGFVLSTDRKKVFVNTWPRCGIEVIDRASHQVIHSFELDEPSNAHRYWLRSFAVEPQDRLVYTIVSTRTKQLDRFDIEMPKFAVVDPAAQKIVRFADYPKEELSSFANTGGLKISPDGKYLYQFRDKLLIFDTTDFKLVDKIELARPAEFAEMENINVTIGDDPHDPPGIVTSVFTSADPIVHRQVFGIARVDLAQRTYEFTPVGPATTFMTGLKLSPDRKTGYLVAYRDTLGNRHTEFWVFDMTTKKIVKTVEFPAPTQIRFTLSGDGKKIFIYGSAPLVDIYDTATMKIKKTLDMNADLSGTMLVVPPTPA